ncbi:hypothetical protein CR513_54824, partial [Mucuna pruriens]
MGNSSAAQVCILALIMFFSTFFMTLHARSLHGHPLIVHKKIVDIQKLLQKSGIHLSKHVYIRDGSVPLAPGDRLAPGGPDPQHNGKAPPRSKCFRRSTKRNRDFFLAI